MSSAPDAQRGKSRRSILVLLPLVFFIGLAVLFYFGLGTGDPSKLPSALIGKAAPVTELPPIPGLTRDGQPVPGIDAVTFKGKVSLVNVWASWCVPCHDEAPLLDAMSKDDRFQIVGINYKDAAENARRFLNRYGNPFAAAGQDTNGRASIDWGVYGVPETYVVTKDGRIAFKLVGPITEANLKSAVMPAIEKALAE